MKKKEKTPEGIIKSVKKSRNKADVRNMLFGLVVGVLLGVLGNFFINSLYDLANAFGGVLLLGKIILTFSSLGAFLLLLCTVYTELLR